MREIKFRVWDKEQKVMYEVKKVDFSEQKVFCEQYYLNDWKFSEIELMQFSGLKDANGKEIYEGDIVVEGYKGKYGTYEVKWNKIGFNLGSEDGRDYEVIGNIYEEKKHNAINPESGLSYKLTYSLIEQNKIIRDLIKERENK